MGCSRMLGDAITDALIGQVALLGFGAGGESRSPLPSGDLLGRPPNPTTTRSLPERDDFVD